MSAEMTPKQFDSVASQLPNRLEPKNIEMARLVLVDGQKQSAVAEQYGVKKTVVNRHVQRIRQVWSGAPGGWVKTKGYFPAEVAACLDKYAEELMAANAAGKNYWVVPGPDLTDALQVHQNTKGASCEHD